MSREILFRAWQDNEMLTQPISGVYGLIRFLGMLYEDAIIEQYTEQKDKNKKKIFDGDILFGREEGDGETTAWTDVYYIVFFNQKYGRWQVRQKNTDIKEGSCWCDDLCDIVDDYEITGNIHDEDKS